jgi:hypothetical protein
MLGLEASTVASLLVVPHSRNPPSVSQWLPGLFAQPVMMDSEDSTAMVTKKNERGFYVKIVTQKK